MFTIYTDKPTDFECKIELTGASLKEAEARLIVTTSDKKMLFEGKVGKNGEVKVNIPKVKGMLEEEDSGNIELEVIIDKDVYFQPWSGKYNVSTSKKVWVTEVVGGDTNSKPVMNVSIKPQNSDYDRKINHIVESLNEKNISARNILTKKNKKIVYSLMESTFKKKIKSLKTQVILSDIVYKLNEDR